MEEEVDAIGGGLSYVGSTTFEPEVGGKIIRCVSHDYACLVKEHRFQHREVLRTNFLKRVCERTICATGPTKILETTTRRNFGNEFLEHLLDERAPRSKKKFCLDERTRKSPCKRDQP